MLPVGETYLELLEGQGPQSGARIAFIDPTATGNVLIELAELPPSHGTPA